MRLLASLLLAFTALAAQAGEPASAPEMSMTATGEIVIAPDGSVREHKLDKGLAAAIETLIDTSVRAWRFEPILIDGRAVIATTRMSLELTAVPTAEGDYTLTLSSASFGVPASYGKLTRPHFPKAALREQVGARSLLIARLDAQGQVVAVHAYQTSLSRNLHEARARKMRELFETAGIKAVMQWKFTPGETLDGVVMGGSFSVPVEFDVTSHPGDNHWHAYVPGPISPAPWIDENRVAQVDTDALADGDIGPLDSRFKLTSDVIGKAL